MVVKQNGAAPRRGLAISSLLNFLVAFSIIWVKFEWYALVFAMVPATALAALIGWWKWDRVMGLAILCGLVGWAAAVVPLLLYIANSDWGA